MQIPQQNLDCYRCVHMLYIPAYLSECDQHNLPGPHDPISLLSLSTTDKISPRLALFGLLVFVISTRRNVKVQTLSKMVRSSPHFRHSYCGSVKQMVLDFEKRFDDSSKSQNASRYYGRSISENCILKESYRNVENDFELRFDRYKQMKSLDSVYFNPHLSLTITSFPEDLLNESEVQDFPKHKDAKICRLKETAVKRQSKLVDLDSSKTFYQNDPLLSAANSNEIAYSGLPLSLRNSVKTRKKSSARPQMRRTKKVTAENEFDEEMSRILQRMQNIEREVEQLSIRRNSSLEELNIYVTSVSDEEDIFGQTDFTKPDDLTFVETYNNLGSEIVFTSVGEVRQRTLSSVENLEDEVGEGGCEIRNQSSGVVRRETFYDIFRNPRIEKVSSATEAGTGKADEDTATRRICHFDYGNSFRSR